MNEAIASVRALVDEHEVKRDRQAAIVEREQGKLRELEEKVRAFRLTLEAMGGMAAAGTPPIAPSSTAPTTGAKSIAAAVREYVQAAAGEFTVADIAAALEAEGTPAKEGAIQTALARAVKADLAVAVRPQSGRIPGVYRRTEKAPSRTESVSHTNGEQLYSGGSEQAP